MDSPVYRLSTSHDDAQIVILTSYFSSNIKICINVVLNAFTQMGASEKELEREKFYLETSPLYFNKWVRSLPVWLPSEAMYSYDD
tara:strand:- start:467 stop:721 length:255 start_codon:yes stop_codon:yes gene_type:complete